MPKPIDHDDNVPSHKPMKPLFSYYGGKQRLAKKIVDLLPRHTVYVEPFAGGAAVFFKKPWPPITNKDHYREVLNDLDNRIINLYRVCQNPEEFERFRQLVTVPHSRAMYEAAQQTTTQDIEYTSAFPEFAAAHWVNIQQSFSLDLTGGFSTGVHGQSKAATHINKIKRLPQYLDRMMSVSVECDEALRVIERYDSPQTLFYCDPPYPGAHQGHYSGYTQENFEDLCNTLDNASGSFVLSNYDNPAATPHWPKHTFSAFASSSGKGVTGNQKDRTKKADATIAATKKRTECLWIVDRSHTARKECQAIWEKWGWEQGVGMGQVKWRKPK